MVRPKLDGEWHCMIALAIFAVIVMAVCAILQALGYHG